MNRIEGHCRGNCPARRPHRPRIGGASLLWSIGFAVFFAGGVFAESVDFVRDVQPILKSRCYSCHGEQRQRSGLRLDVKSEAFRGGELYDASIVAGDPDESPLVRFVADEDADLEMPPGERLPDDEIEILTRWVRQGAPWPDGVDPVTLEDPLDHWSLQPIADHPAPDPAPDLSSDRGTKRADGNVSPGRHAGLASWPRGKIDRFVLARLLEAGLRPAAEAPREEWLRRVTLDLTGLPPTPNELQTFLDDRSPEAHARVVDRLLASPRYGERWAQRWLDVVRYADTHGFEVNTERPHAWPYRDYVIEAFNRDLPFDDFVREQLAGDQLGADPATGFLVTASVLLPGQIGKDDASKRLARQDSIDEIVINVSNTFLGLTVGCARCHDHKFDPISQHDYYAMQAFVAGVEYKDRTWSSNRAETPTGGDAEPPKVFAGRFREPDPIRLLTRGDPEQPRERVAPAVPAALGGLELAKDAPGPQRRRALAEWIVDGENPLTARVIVNRIWQGHFGSGLVETPNDFGRSGQPPSHPELLDRLASDFVRSGWSIKRLHRRIVLSSTYRQSSFEHPDPEPARQTDAGVKLLWRYPARRLEAEAIRDSMLAVSGELDFAAGGRGFDLFDKRGGLSGFRPIESFDPAGLRRMIYAHKVRREQDGVFGAFDCPDAGQSTPRRRESMTPIQALNLFNSRFTIERSGALASRVESEVGSDVTAGVDQVYRLALGRDPTPPERSDAVSFVTEHGLATFCRVVFNSNEFLFVP